MLVVFLVDGGLIDKIWITKVLFLWGEFRYLPDVSTAKTNPRNGTLQDFFEISEKAHENL
jgi:hypothetical protein